MTRWAVECKVVVEVRVGGVSGGVYEVDIRRLRRSRSLRPGHTPPRDALENVVPRPVQKPLEEGAVYAKVL
jgi:hypothetical protein